MRLSRARIVLCMLIGLGIGATIAAASFDFDEYFDLYNTQYYIIDHDFDGVDTTVQVERSGLRPGNQFDLQLKMHVDGVGLLTDLRFQVGNDVNSNGVIDGGEWLTAAVASIVEHDGVTDASTVVFAVGGDYDAYRVYSVRTDLGVSVDAITTAEVDID